MDTPDVSHLLARVPGWQGRAHVVGALGGGITNRNLLVEVRGADRVDRVDLTAQRFVLRLAGKDTELLEIRRSVEHEAATRAASLGLAPEVTAFLEPEGYLITRFVDASPLPPDELASPQRLAEIAHMLRSFHTSGPLSGDFDAFRVPFLHHEAARGRGVAIPEQFATAAEFAARIEAAFDASPEPRVPCHNDLLNANFLTDETQIWLLDWEYAGNNDRYFDLGNLSVNNGLDDGPRAALLGAYFGAPTPRRSARLDLMMIMSDFREAMWGVVQQGISTLEFDYVEYATTHLDRLVSAASRPGFATLLDAAAAGSPDA